MVLFGLYGGVAAHAGRLPVGRFASCDDGRSGEGAVVLLLRGVVGWGLPRRFASRNDRWKVAGCGNDGRVGRTLLTVTMKTDRLFPVGGEWLWRNENWGWVSIAN
jgi:hypothetical protein